jgi:hypothetical protein
MALAKLVHLVLSYFVFNNLFCKVLDYLTGWRNLALNKTIDLIN